jgi:hypothetical protein
MTRKRKFNQEESEYLGYLGEDRCKKRIIERRFYKYSYTIKHCIIKWLFNYEFTPLPTEYDNETYYSLCLEDIIFCIDTEKSFNITEKLYVLLKNIISYARKPWTMFIYTFYRLDMYLLCVDLGLFEMDNNNNVFLDVGIFKFDEINMRHGVIYNVWKPHVSDYILRFMVTL